MLPVLLLAGLGCGTGELKAGLGPPTVGPNAPTAAANGPYSGTTGMPVQFSSSGSFDPDGTWTATWDFGDGTSVQAVNPAHTYASAGNYTAVLTVTDTSGLSDSDTASVQVVSTPPPTAGHPHEPVGYTPFADVSFSSMIEYGPAPVGGGTQGGVADGCAWYSAPATNLSAGSDSLSPKSAPGVLDIKYPTGTTPGAGVGLFQVWDDCSEGDGTEYEEIYESGYVMINGPDFETNSTLVKIWGYWGYGFKGQGSVPAQIALVIRGPGTGTQIMSSWSLRFNQQDNVDRGMNQNANPGFRIQAGAWYHYEVVMKMNSAPGIADGILKAWFNGTLVFDYSNVEFRTVGATSGFFGRRWDPVWGGAGGTPKTRDDHVFIDHVYLSGK